jgi:hypothetical protein
METMTQDGKANGVRRYPGWMVFVWGGAALLWLAPLIAMQVTHEVAWDLADFAVFGVMLAVACCLLELSVRLIASRLYRLLAASGIAAAFLLVWAQLAVGIIG